jgi:hypothetical protein
VAQLSAIICHAMEDAGVVGNIAAYLEINCALTVSLVVSRDTGPDLIEAVEIGLSADIVLVALSPASAPNPWKRERWEPVFLRQPGEFGTRMACLLLRECRFPELFRRGNFFDLSEDSLTGMRALKRWVYGGTERVGFRKGGRFEALRCRIADRPGVESGVGVEEALAFSEECREDFEGVFRIDCARRGRAGILGDTGHALGMRLADSAERNRTTLVDFCASRRCLFLFDHLAEDDRDVVDLGGKTSIIFTEGELQERRSFGELGRLFTHWPRHPDDCLRALGDAQSWLQGGEVRASMQLGFAVLALLKNFDRLAEACEILDLMANTARSTGDLLTAHRLVWEQSTIRQQWGESAAMPEGVVMPEATQLVLEFGERG